ncbi:peptidase S41 family protein-like protein [Lindgomyces ingoldianus]|uniref:Peptidase S41 family protein-like protein n=1 Tax=Lindgomyces ingoldianus TaxID=673940 RepID=A0ACB6RBH6_9PLEO|nr:peptidase S41 family protein-like protein [Lindgomyces ingoldianus]KAF2476536.1 peptidase S41 family protein-like protein [Lindgomyces ingoldianus]
MMLFIASVAGFSFASIALATPFHLNTRQNASSPCALVSASAAAQTAAAVPTVPAQLAYDCITSVPFNKSAALSLLDAIVPYFRWQSTTAFLKDPPEEYIEKIQDAVDVWGGLESIKSKVEGSSYANEFEFGWALYRLLQSTHDGHFVFIPDVIGTVFNWARPIPLVSVSEDGKALPKPYVYPDVLASSLGNASFTPSAISTINGQNAKEYLENWAQYGSLQDRDALYNNVFYELAVVSLGPSGAGMGSFTGGGRGRWVSTNRQFLCQLDLILTIPTKVYPGPTTELGFENGTTTTYNNYAKVLVSFAGVTDGESLYKKCTPAPGYPPPIFKESHNLIGGYYLEGDYSDVAVLSVPSFVSLDSAEIPFQQVSEQFLAAARAAGKKKLIVDVSANGGGTILQGYDLYKQLFPALIGYAAGDRFRAFESTNIIGKKFSNVAEGLPRVLETSNDTLLELEYDVVSSVFNYQTDMTTDGKNFPDWPAKFGPVHQHGDNYTNLFRWNLSDILTPLNSGGIYVHGYSNITNSTQPFPAKDVVVVTDGYCASTCTIFSELMRQRAGVKYISLGGRSKPGITQAVGGVKGTNNFPWDYIQYLAQYTVTNISTAAEGAELNATELGQYWSNVPFDRMAIGSAINVNFRDGIRDGDDTNTPLQFVYEPADCRILYTKEMTVDVTAIWKAVADSAWGATNRCVAGDLGGYGKRELRRGFREKRWEDRALERRMEVWRRGLSVKDYPLDVFTDPRQTLNGNGIMYP